jgi:cysteine desulfurase / selenocysteine lyase
MAHEAGAKVLFDGSQAAVHRRVDVQAIGCDFYASPATSSTGRPASACSGQGRAAGRMPPFLGGGDMISVVTFEKSVWAPPPAKFEAGTPAIIEAVGLHAAIDYVTAIGMGAIEAHERALVDHAMARCRRSRG